MFHSGSSSDNKEKAKSWKLSPLLTKDSMLAIRSGIPLALQSKKRKRNLNPKSTSEKSVKESKVKGDLGIRKDLTLPTAPTAGEDNVFQVTCTVIRA